MLSAIAFVVGYIGLFYVTTIVNSFCLIVGFT